MGPENPQTIGPVILINNDSKTESTYPLTKQEQQERLPEQLGGVPEEVGEEILLTTEEILLTTEDKDTSVDSKQLSWRDIGTLYNNMSIVVKISVLGGIRCPTLLFPGDLSDWTSLILYQWGNLQADVFKLPHHGSRRVDCDVQTIYDCLEWGYYGPPGRLWPYRRFYHQWEQLSEVVNNDSPIDLIRTLVNPSYTLVFPYPAHKLPSLDLKGFSPNIVANRTNRDLQELNSKSNEPSPLALSIGLKHNDINEIQLCCTNPTKTCRNRSMNMRLEISEAISLILALPAHRSSNEGHRKMGEKAFELLFDYKDSGTDDTEKAFNRAMIGSVLSTVRAFSVERDRISGVWKSIEAIKKRRERYLEVTKNLYEKTLYNYDITKEDEIKKLKEYLLKLHVYF